MSETKGEVEKMLTLQKKMLSKVQKKEGFINLITNSYGLEAIELLIFFRKSLQTIIGNQSRIQIDWQEAS